MSLTKIVCTMGPSSNSISILKEMMNAGMNVARLNMAHGELSDHSGRISLIREAAAEASAVVAVMMDIKGPEVRIGTLQEDSYELQTGAKLTLTSRDIVGDGNCVAVNYEDMPKVVTIGSRILIDDGLIELIVESIEGTEIICTIMNGGRLKPRKGVNLPSIRTTLPGVTERDIRHIAFGVKEGVDIIAVSFVRKAEDILHVRQLLEQAGAGHIQIISKIENEEGVENLDSIIEVSDGIMVARGDLGVEIPAEDVPMIQREMIQKCNLAGKPVIVATQMLDSMQVNPRPTRAEVSDVANAVLQGADAIMLSGETAAGKYPLESVKMMSMIATRAESTINYGDLFQSKMTVPSSSVTEVISQAVVSSSLQLDAKAILTPTESGFSARMVSKYHPKAPIIAITAHDHVLKRLTLVRGVIPIKGEATSTTDEMFKSAIRNGSRTNLLQSGDFVIISAGVPSGKAGATNLIRIHQME
ncbi:pyruvate kinase [Paenibacillus sp. GSMTC-2017]|uniref:pyruvate kinase n=1 Tax=Paenibacillus sp. GSMTC-2017 TaxID=2794350 RepID=UPI0018D97594|nr:pyruvate kinase [Paenibacillus sp. GSMTC-2017]MBH5317692.1 pyruvate kinase [Paenibacillus sp. GSMTC-2017]